MNSDKYVLFWDGPFSQWQRSPFEAFGIQFSHAEQFMMWSKARIFGDKETEKLILAAKTPKEQKMLGRKVKNFIPERWDKVSMKAVYIGSYLKYSQNKDLYEELEATEGKILVEASPYDKIWGIGLDEEHPDALDETKWRGENRLGKVLTELRQDFAQERGIPFNKVRQYSEELYGEMV